MNGIDEVVVLETKGVEVRKDEEGVGGVVKEEFVELFGALWDGILQVERPHANLVPIYEVQEILDENVGIVHEVLVLAERRSSEGDAVEEEGRGSDGSAACQGEEVVLLEGP